MKRSVTAARRYAEAAFQLATRDGTVDDWQARLDRLAELISDARMERLVGNPAVPPADRERVVLDALGWSGDEPPVNLVRLLLRRGRLRLAGAIAAEFRALVQRSRGIVGATVSAAAALTPAETDAIRQRLEAMTGRTVELAVRLDPDLIGGVAVRIGDRMIDASVRGRLRRLRDRLVAGASI